MEKEKGFHMINKTSPISFSGLKIEGVIPSKNMKKLCEFASAVENIEFIEHLEKNFNTDMVINSNFDEISFSHNTYGNLTNFGCPKFSVADFYSKVVDAMNDIKCSIKKAEKHHKKQDYEKMSRGC